MGKPEAVVCFVITALLIMLPTLLLMNEMSTQYYQDMSIYLQILVFSLVILSYILGFICMYVVLELLFGY